MANMHHCRYENTANDLDQLWDEWWNDDPAELNEYEQRARLRLIRLVRDMHGEFEDNDTYDELDAAVTS